MRFHARLERMQPARLPDSHYLFHLRLQNTQVAQHLRFKLRHPTSTLIGCCKLQLTGAFTNKALENREYSGGELASYIRT
jgi:hypothetical protein